MRHLFVFDSLCVNSLKTADFSLSTPLSQCLYLRGRSGFLEIVFVGECEALVCL